MQKRTMLCATNNFRAKVKNENARESRVGPSKSFYSQKTMLCQEQSSFNNLPQYDKSTKML